MLINSRNLLQGEHETHHRIPQSFRNFSHQVLLELKVLVEHRKGELAESLPKKELEPRSLLYVHAAKTPGFPYCNGRMEAAKWELRFIYVEYVLTAEPRADKPDKIRCPVTIANYINNCFLKYLLGINSQIKNKTEKQWRPELPLLWTHTGYDGNKIPRSALLLVTLSSSEGGYSGWPWLNQRSVWGYESRNCEWTLKQF